MYLFIRICRSNIAWIKIQGFKTYQYVYLMSKSLALHNASWPLSIPKYLGHYPRGNDFGSSHFASHAHAFCQQDIKEKKQMNILKCAKEALGVIDKYITIFYEVQCTLLVLHLILGCTSAEYYRRVETITCIYIY